MRISFEVMAYVFYVDRIRQYQLGRAPRAQCPHHLVGAESLPDQVSIETAELGPVGRPAHGRAAVWRATASINASGSIDSNTSSVARRAVARAIPACSIWRRTRSLPRRFTDACDRAIAAAIRASSIARSARRRATAESMSSGRVLAARQALPDLCFRQLAARQHPQGVDVRVGHCPIAPLRASASERVTSARHPASGSGHLVAARCRPWWRCPGPSA